jgi:hypothetical protein
MDVRPRAVSCGTMLRANHCLRLLLLATLSALGTGPLSAQVSDAPTPAADTPAAPATAAKAAAKPKRAPAQAGAPARVVPESTRTSLAKHLPMQAQRYYEGAWGIDSLTVKYTESGEIIRFSYRVLDPQKAATLNDKKLEPSLSDAQARVSLVVPQMEKIGQLRQSSTPIAGKSYWMAFSNTGRRVKPGHRVDVQIGSFHADGLVVE